MSLAKEFPCGHLRFLPTRYSKCFICEAQKVAEKRKRQTDFACKVAGTAAGVKKSLASQLRRPR